MIAIRDFDGDWFVLDRMELVAEGLTYAEAVEILSGR
jgi:hypothetical protein